jgi:nuclear receptor interaction protein
MDAIQDYLIPYLLELASDEPVVNVDSSKFETDATRILFDSETDAVNAFAHAVTIPFADLTGTEETISTGGSMQEPEQHRVAAKRRWAYMVGRGVLLNAAKDIKFAFVDCAYGGRGISDKKIKAEEQALMEQHEDIDPLLDEGPIRDVDVTSRAPTQAGSGRGDPSSNSPTASGSRLAILEAMEEDEEDEDEDDDDDDDDDDGDTDSDDESEEEGDGDSSEEEDDDGLRRTRSGHMLWRSDFGRSRYKRWKVEADVPCAPHTRVYTGHCNVKTVKDVNYFGLQDEYVVSGSDSGHVFIWDRKTSQLVNILEGDGEVVNVIQGNILQ